MPAYRVKVIISADEGLIHVIVLSTDKMNIMVAGRRYRHCELRFLWQAKGGTTNKTNGETGTTNVTVFETKPEKLKDESASSPKCVEMTVTVRRVGPLSTGELIMELAGTIVLGPVYLAFRILHDATGSLLKSLVDVVSFMSLGPPYLGVKFFGGW